MPTTMNAVNNAPALIPGTGITITGTTATGYTVNATGGGVPDGTQIYWVADNGNDANSGLNIANPLATFNQAITLASALTPSATNRFSVICLDDGIFTEDIVGAQYVDIFAPCATIVATSTGLLVADNAHFTFQSMQVPDGAFAVIKGTSDSAISWVKFEDVTCVGYGNGFVNASTNGGVLMCEWKTLIVQDGVGVGDLATTYGHMHILGGDIYITGTTGDALALARGNSGSVVGRVDHIVQIGAGATGTAIYMIEGTLDVNVSLINCTAAINIDGSAGPCTLNLFCNDLNGTQTAANGAISNVTTPGQSGGEQLIVFARLTSTQSNVLGDGTPYPIVYDTADINIGGCYNASSGVFTAPATAKYRFESGILFTGLTSNPAFNLISLLVSDGTASTQGGYIYTTINQSLAAFDTDTILTTGITYLPGATTTAGDLINNVANVSGGTDTVNILGASNQNLTWWAIYRVA